MSAIYLNDWSKPGWRDLQGLDALKADFQIDDATLEGCDILLATYGECYGYDGGAFVLLRKDGKFYEVNGSHCSCYGLEDQWKPEETTVQALRFRIEQGALGKEGDHEYAVELGVLLDQLEAA